MTRTPLILTLSLLAACKSTMETPPSGQDELVDAHGHKYPSLGQFHRPVATDSQAAADWFDRGLALCYGFNHEEAVRCFERALEFDPELAMAHWGHCLCSRPEYQ